MGNFRNLGCFQCGDDDRGRADVQTGLADQKKKKLPIPHPPSSIYSSTVLTEVVGQD